MKRIMIRNPKVWKVMKVTDILFAATGIALSALAYKGIIPVNPWGWIGIIGMISGILDGSAFIAYEIKKARALQKAGFEEGYEDGSEEDEE